MPRCYKCTKNRKTTDFYKNSSRPSGRQSYCKWCNSDWVREHYEQRKPEALARSKEARRRNTKFVLDYLSAHPCVDCNDADLLVLEFDHVRGKKLLAVTVMVTRGFSLEKIAEEIEKCDVRCVRCHRRRTILMNPNNLRSQYLRGEL